MNASVYLFGEFNSGYSQYPDDYASIIFHKFSANIKAATQIAIHRDGNLVYYGYIRKLQQGRYIGLCVVLNGLMLKRIDNLFSIFENTISDLVTKGNLIHFNEQGDMVTSVDQLYLSIDEIDNLTESLIARFNMLEGYVAPLPAVSYSTSKDSCKVFDADDDHDEIVKSSHTNGYTYIYKSDDYNTSQLHSYIGVLKRSYKAKQELAAKLAALEKEHAKTLKQKKQFKVVFILFAILFCCGIGIFTLNNTLTTTQDALSYANDTIRMQNDSLKKQSTQISSLKDRNHKLNLQWRHEQTMRMAAEDRFEKFKHIIDNHQSFVVTGTSFDFASGYLSFNYYGLTTGSVNITVRAFDDYGNHYINNSSIYINSGDNHASIYLSRSLNSTRWYSFELLEGNRIIGGERH
ncbi:MAG: hypothetical protein ACI306_04880 [Muribaculaceae bacterium]